VRTEWTAFLDDDDTMNPVHIGALMKHAEATGADVVYPWFDVPGGFDPFPQYEGQPFNEKALREVQNYIPVTVLVRTGLARGVGGFTPRNTSTAAGASPCEEWGLWLKLLDIGANFAHLDQRTWRWNWHEGNTSGRGDRW
jgi:Glycosyl transferase family 2